MNDTVNQPTNFANAGTAAKIKLGVLSTVAIVIGYVILAGMNMAFVIYWFINGNGSSNVLATGIAAVLFTSVCALFGGYITALIARRTEVRHTVILAVIMGTVIIFSLIANVAVEPQWYKVIYLLTMVPATIAGGRLRLIQKTR